MSLELTAPAVVPVADSGLGAFCREMTASERRAFWACAAGWALDMASRLRTEADTAGWIVRRTRPRIPRRPSRKHRPAEQSEETPCRPESP
jgi:hypothetical protein